jgi:hypothetical protein
MQANRHLKRNHSRIASSDSEHDNGGAADEEMNNPETNPPSSEPDHPRTSLVNNEDNNDAEPPRSSQDSNGSCLDDLMELQPPLQPVVEDVPEYYANDFATVSDRLRNVQPMQSFDVSLGICDDFHHVIFPELRHIVTMDGVSKSFVTIQPKDPSHLVQPYEGASFTFVDR